MKRKLDEHDQPAPAPSKSDAAPENESTWTDLGLDSRLLQAIASQNWTKPTLVQSRAIPPALDGRDVLAKAKTGSGKTSAYLLPILQGILKRKQVWGYPVTPYIAFAIL